MADYPKITLNAGAHKRVASGHPWLYSNEIKMTEAAKTMAPGAIVCFEDHVGKPLGVGSYNPKSLIAGRIFDHSPIAILHREWIANRLRTALELRQTLYIGSYYRLIHAEADGLPGLVVDRFGDTLVVQLNTAGTEMLWPEIQAALESVLKPKVIVLRNDGWTRKLEGLEETSAVVKGKLDGPIEVHENGALYFADLEAGSKTGWYFDMREHRTRVAVVAKDRSVLDLYCHTGGFGLLALNHGARSVIGVDSSAPALKLAAMAAEHTGHGNLCQWKKADVFEYLEGRPGQFDIVIADPPPFVRSKKDAAQGARAYRKLARLATACVNHHGFLFIASCSHNISLDELTEQVARGIFDAHRQGRILHAGFADADHPVHPHLPETSYLKALWVEID